MTKSKQLLAWRFFHFQGFPALEKSFFPSTWTVNFPSGQTNAFHIFHTKVISWLPFEPHSRTIQSYRTLWNGIFCYPIPLPKKPWSTHASEKGSLHNFHRLGSTASAASYTQRAELTNAYDINGWDIRARRFTACRFGQGKKPSPEINTCCRHESEF